MSPGVADLDAAVGAVVQEAREPDGPRWLALRVESTGAAPLRGLGSLSPLLAAGGFGESFRWECAAESRFVVGVGALHVVEVAGPRRFGRASCAARALFDRVRVLGAPAPEAAGPLLVGGFAFDDSPCERAVEASPGWSSFPPGRMVLPRRLFVRDGERSWCTVVRELSAGADARREANTLRVEMSELLATLKDAGAAVEPVSPRTGAAPAYRAIADASPAEYRDRVRAALGAIASGELEKVVVARSASLHSEGGFDAGSLLASLRRTYPSCVAFAVTRGEKTWLGATPERLVALAGDRVSTCAVAGSAPRGRSPERDAELARELRESKKEQSEHGIVVRAIRDALRSDCGELEGPETPALLRIEGIQHLETPLSGRLRPRTSGAPRPSVLDLVARLHPTPAVCGAPRAAASRWLRENEELDRGWYAGPIGFVDASGGGEFRVALRAALIEGVGARLFAGSGIVSGSDPDRELRETRLKLSALLSPMLEI